jgi:hypothetical protein
VVSFLREASTATADREAGRSAAQPGEPAGAVKEAGAAHGNGAGGGDGNLAVLQAQGRGGADQAEDQLAAQSVAVKAAAMSVATLDRIEAAAAKVEADIAAALQAHAELQAGAGAAAEAAVSAAQEAWIAAGNAVEADEKAGSKLRLVMRYTLMTTVIVVVEFVIFILFATSAH